MTLYRQKNIVININWWEELRVANKKWSLSEVCISSFIVNKTNKFMYTRRQQNKACHIFHLSNCYWYYFLWQLMKLFKVTKCRLTCVDKLVYHLFISNNIVVLLVNSIIRMNVFEWNRLVKFKFWSLRMEVQGLRINV